MNIDLRTYTPADAPAWDAAVAQSRNGTFLHTRAYIDYRDDAPDAASVVDASLMAVDDRGRVIAVLPGCRCGDTVYSHRYLTYGGWVMTDRATLAVMQQVWAAAFDLWRSQGVKTLVYKPVPYIYHRYPADDDLYALHLAGAQQSAVLTSSAILLDAPIRFDLNARRGVKTAQAAGVVCRKSERWADFWGVLGALLHERYGTTPVHTLEQMQAIRRRCPGCVSLYTAEVDGRVEAGVVIYHAGPVDHAQYIAASPVGKELCLLPALFSHVIACARLRGARYLDLGTSNEDHGRKINEGLIRQKTGFGGRTIVYPEYTLPL